MNMHREELENIKKDLDDPVQNQAQDKILADKKFAIVFANEFYSN